MTLVNAKKKKTNKQNIFSVLKSFQGDLSHSKKMQLLSGQRCDMNMHELLAAHLHGTVGGGGLGV